MKEKSEEKEEFRADRFTTQPGEMELILPEKEEKDGERKVQEEQ